MRSSTLMLYNLWRRQAGSNAHIYTDEVSAYKNASNHCIACSVLCDCVIINQKSVAHQCRVINECRQITVSSPGRWKRVITQQLNDTSSHLYCKAMLQWVIKYCLSVHLCLTACNLSVCACLSLIVHQVSICVCLHPSACSALRPSHRGGNSLSSLRA